MLVLAVGRQASAAKAQGAPAGETESVAPGGTACQVTLPASSSISKCAAPFSPRTFLTLAVSDRH
jgi:hypothetical protein